MTVFFIKTLESTTGNNIVDELVTKLLQDRKDAILGIYHSHYKQKIPDHRDLTFHIQTYLISTGTEILSQSIVNPFLLIL